MRITKLYGNTMETEDNLAKHYADVISTDAIIECVLQQPIWGE